MATPTTATYVLTKDEGGVFVDMGIVAATLLRHFEPDMPVVFLLDRPSFESLGGRLDVMGRLGRVIPVDSEHGHAVARNRDLKTRMRSIISGPLLYMDADAILVGKISDRLPSGADVAAGLDRCSDSPFGSVPDFARDHAGLLGWPPYRSDDYRNAGVVFLADTPPAHAFASAWHQRWLEGVGRKGELRDQPAFNSAAISSDSPVARLDRSLNEIVLASDVDVRGARVLHFYAHGGAPAEGSLLSWLLGTYRRTGRVDLDAVLASRWTGTAWAVGHRWTWTRRAVRVVPRRSLA